MQRYNVTGMSCAACSVRVEKAVSKLSGVTECSVSLLTNSMGVEGEVSASEVIAAVEAAGYGASFIEKPDSGNEGNSDGKTVNQGNGHASREMDALEDKETPKMKKRLFASLIFLIVLMYFSMGHMMWNWPVPVFFAENHVAMGLLQLLLTGAVMVINQKFFISGFRGLLHRAPNMDTLVALGSAAAFSYSTYALFAMTDAQAKGDMEAVMMYMHEFYFESAAMILTLITVGKMLEARSKGKTTDALKGLMNLEPKTATLLIDGAEQVVPIAQVKKGDCFVVRPGEQIPTDGMILEGNGAVNEASLTGESIPVDKGAGDHVYAATINQSGFLRCEATKVGEDTTLSQIIKMVSDAAATKAPIAKVADTVSGFFVPVVIGIAALTILIWLLVGESVGFALARGISVLVISCPCALGLATPVAIMVGNGVVAKNGILFKTAVSLEETGKVGMVALDKTGTITIGEPKVTDYFPAEGITEKELLQYAYALEQKSEHPLAKAIVEEARMKGTALMEVQEFEALPGNGLQAVHAHDVIAGGSMKFIGSRITLSEDTGRKAEELADKGKTPLLFTLGGKYLGMIAVADVIREDSRNAVKELRDMGIRVIMLSGDNERTAKAIGDQVGVDEVIAGVLPDGKEQVIRQLSEQGKVAMVGDGINDAPALTRANIGIAIGAGTDIAIDAADIVLMKNRLSDVAAGIRLSRATLRNIHQNLFWAFFYNVIGIPLAAGAWIHWFGWQLNPMFAAAAMSLSSFCVVSNALRLNLVKLYQGAEGIGHQSNQMNQNQNQKTENIEGRSDQIDLNQKTEDVKQIRNNKKEKESKNMTKTLVIEGMMCGHCEARVKKLLEGFDGITEAVVSHESGTAVITTEKEPDEAAIRKAIEEDGYKYIEMK